MSDGAVLVPCPNCGADIMAGEATTTVVQMDTCAFRFQGQPPERELEARICPDCGTVTAL